MRLKGAGRGTHSRISGRTTVKPPTSARTCIVVSPFVMPPSTMRCFRSVLESSFMLSRISRVWNAFASSVARQMCPGVVYAERPETRWNLDSAAVDRRIRLTDEETACSGVPVGREQTGKGRNEVDTAGALDAVCEDVDVIRGLDQSH